VKGLMYCISVAGITAALWLGVEKTGFGVSLPVSRISINGNHRVSESRILNRIGVEKGVNMFSLSLEEAARRLQSMPWIRDVSIHRVFPDQMVIWVREFIPVARVKLDSGVWGLVEEEGTIIPLSPEEVAQDAMGLWEICFSESSASLENLSEAVSLVRLLQSDSEIRGIVGSIAYHPKTGLSVLIGKEFPLPVRFGRDNFALKLKRLKQLRTYLRIHPVEIEEIDLDFPDRALARIRPERSGNRGGGRG